MRFANITLEKLEKKLQCFTEMESVLRTERQDLERGRQQLFLDRLAFKRRVRSVQEGFQAAAALSGDQGAKLAAEATREGEGLGYQFNSDGQKSSAAAGANGQLKTFEA